MLGEFQHVVVSSVGPSCGEGLDCVLLVHNERRLLEEFYAHYRRLGVRRFLVVDDRSTDGSREWLAGQPDTIVFTPAPGTSYKTHKKQWRSEILDACCEDRWVIVPDADEWFVYRDMETKPLPALIAELEAEGARVLPAIMVDMYRDAPLSRHVYEGGGLLEAFPCFDGEGYYQLPVPARSMMLRYPCPWFIYVGGMRHRLFGEALRLPIPFAHALFARACALERAPVGTAGRLWRILTAVCCFGKRVKQLHNVAKVPLVKWRRGLRFSGGAHSLSGELPVSSRRAALLHFKFTAGVDQIAYIANRGEHASGSAIYRRILASGKLDATPVCAITRRYEGSASLGDLLR